MPTTTLRRLLRRVVFGGFVVFCVFALFFLGGAVKTRSERDRCRRVVAYRDDVPLWQELGSWLYALPFFAAGYDDVVAVTGNGRDAHDEFVAGLDAAADAGCDVDVWLMVLGGNYAPWIADAQRHPDLHLVYDTGGGDLRYADHFVDGGADVVVAHKGDNVAPVFFTFFLPGVVRGVDLDDNVAAANAKTQWLLEAIGLPQWLRDNTIGVVRRR